MAKGKTTLIHHPTSMNFPKRLLTHNVLTDVENTAQIRKGIYYSLISRESSPRNRKDVAREPEAQENYLI